MKNAQVALVRDDRDAQLTSLRESTDRLTLDTSQLRCALSGVLDLQSLANADSEALVRIRAVLELCEAKARSIEGAAAAIDDRVFMLTGASQAPARSSA